MSQLGIKGKFVFLTLLFLVELPAYSLVFAENQWEPAIRQFEQQDAKRPGTVNPVLFVGSSSIRWWRTSELFPEFPVINRGFGGAEISDINYYFNRIVQPYKPIVVVFYCGGNDLFVSNKTPNQVFEEFKKFYQSVQSSFPKTKVIYMSLTPGPSAWDSRERLYTVNRMVKELAEKQTNLVYADVSTGMLNSKGIPNPKDYQDDGVHLTYQADRKWAALLRPILRKTYIEARGAAKSKKPKEPNKPE